MPDNTTSFVYEYEHLLCQEYQELAPLFHTDGPLAGFHLFSCLKDSPDKKTFIITSENEKRLLKVCHKNNFENTKREYDLLKYLSSISDLHVKVYDFFEYEDFSCLVEEYIEGYDLAYLMESGRHFSSDAIIDIGLQLCDILSPLYDQDPPLIHKDIAPSNIVYRNDGRVFLIDFGTVRRYDEGKDTDTVCVVTRATAPPEQYGFSQTDIRSEIYSIGKTLLFLTEDENSITPVLQRTLETCTAFSPDDRYSSTKQLKKALLFAKRHPHSLSQYKSKKALGKKAVVALLLLGILGCGGYYTYLSVPYQFADEQIASAVHQVLDLDDDDPISRKMLRQVDHLYIHGNQVLETLESYRYYDCYAINDGEDLPYEFGSIENLDDLKEMKHLKKLLLCNQNISDVSVLSNLSDLTELYLAGNRIDDVSPLGECSTLSVLCLSCNPATDYSALSELSHLTNVQLGGDMIQSLDFLEGKDLTTFIHCSQPILSEDLTPLLAMYRLEELQIESDSSTVLEIIENNATLYNLVVYGFPAEDLSCLSGCTELRFIHLGAPNLTSVAGVESLQKLEDFGLSNCQHEIDFTPLTECQSLTSVYLQGAVLDDNTRQLLSDITITEE